MFLQGAVQAKKKTGANRTVGEGHVIPTLGRLNCKAYLEVQNIVASAERITVVCGAGISTRAGIPVRAVDDTGLQRALTTRA